MLHAAALADPATGRTAVLVAASGTGKTTASVTLGRSFAYLTDETSAITADGVVLTYRKPLSIIDGGHLKKQVAPSAARTARDRTRVPAGRPARDRAGPLHQGAPTVEPLETVDAIAAIAPQSSYLPSMDKPLHRLAELIHLVGGARHVVRRVGGPRARARPAPGGVVVIVRRGALIDHYVEDERSVVMVDESVLGLSPIATAILEAVPEGVDVDLPTVTQHVVATFGPPPGPRSAEALTEQQIWDLVAHRVLVVVEGEASRDGSRPSSTVGPTRPVTTPRARSPRCGTRYGTCAPTTKGDGQRLTRLSPRGLVIAARQHHVVPYLAANLDRLNIPGQARSELEAAAGRQHAGAAVLAADLSVALAAFATPACGLAFKGVTLARWRTATSRSGDGRPRSLVAPSRSTSSPGATEAGWSPAGYPVPGPPWALASLGTHMERADVRRGPADIDLHWYLVPTRGTFPRFDRSPGPMW